MRLKAKWDAFLTKMKIVKIYDDKSDLFYCYVKTPFIIADRDLTIKRVVLENYKEMRYIFASRSVEDPDFPPNKGVVRAKVVIAGT